VEVEVEKEERGGAEKRKRRGGTGHLIRKFLHPPLVVY